MIWTHIRSLVGATRSKQIPIFEMPLATVQRKRLPKHSTWAGTLAQAQPLQFRGTQLAHAVIKADFLNHICPLMPGIGFVLQSDRIVDWNSHDFCLQPGGQTMLSDFVQTSLAGRLGQGLAILFAQSKGYAFQSHLRELLIQHGIPVIVNGKSLRIADFLMEDGSRNRAIVESKGSISSQTNCPKATKATFKDALQSQVQPWTTRINPPAQKSFVVASYLREPVQSGSDPSVLAFVDPEEDSLQGEFELRGDAVQRENYAAWLSAMGLVESARRLRGNTSEGTRREIFIVLEIAGQSIAFPTFWNRDLPHWDLLLPFHFHYRTQDRLPLLFGLEVSCLEATSRAIQGDRIALEELDVMKTVQDTAMGDTYDFSIFPDGTFFGNIPPQRREFEFKEVVL